MNSNSRRKHVVQQDEALVRGQKHYCSQISADPRSFGHLEEEILDYFTTPRPIPPNVSVAATRLGAAQQELALRANDREQLAETSL